MTLKVILMKQLIEDPLKSPVKTDLFDLDCNINLDGNKTFYPSSSIKIFWTRRV